MRREKGKSWTKEGIRTAINAVQRGQLTQRAATLRYNLPRRTLLDHLKTGTLQNVWDPKNKKIFKNWSTPNYLKRIAGADWLRHF